MIKIKKHYYKFFKLLSWMLFFSPISIGGLSTNYLFVLLYVKSKIKIPKNPIIRVILVYYICSFVIGVFIYSDGDSFFLLRQLISFLLYVSLFLLLFIKIKIDLSFLLRVIILVSSIYSIYVLYVVFTNSMFSLSDIYYIKGGLREYVSDWPQRYVVLLVFGFIVSFSRMKEKKIYIMSTVLVGVTIILTFTRTAYLAICMGMIVYMLLNLKRHPKVSYKSMTVYTVFFVGIVIYMLYFADKRLLTGIEEIVSRLIDAIELFFTSGSGHEGSDSDRLRYWGYGLNVLEKNIITGTGFAGIYLFYPIGSIHSQYMDIFLRTGMIGLLLYLYLWSIALKYYYKYSIPIFSGLVAIFVFGFSHETTKLSYIGLLFFVLLNFALNRNVIAKEISKDNKCAE